MASSDPMMALALQVTFPVLCAAIGIPNSKWQAAYTAVMLSGTNYEQSIAGQAALDSALRAWWKGQGGVILGTALILGSVLGG